MFSRQNEFGEIFNSLLDYGCIKGIKTETDNETSDFRQNLILRELAGRNNLIFAVKSSNSLNDLELAKALGAHWIISPYVESVQSARDFLNRASQTLKGKYFIHAEKKLSGIKCSGFCFKKGDFTVVYEQDKKFFQTGKIIFDSENIDEKIIKAALKFEIAWLEYRENSRCSLNVIEKKRLDNLRAKVIHATIV